MSAMIFPVGIKEFVVFKVGSDENVRPGLKWPSKAESCLNPPQTATFFIKGRASAV